jgi:hypothetical protein
MKKKFPNRSRFTTCLFVAIVILTQCSTETGTSPGKHGELEKGFADPPIENRPLAFWDWLNGYVDTTKLVYELEEMKDKGMQGAFIWDIGEYLYEGETPSIPVGPRFLGEESLDYIRVALETAHRLGLKLGMIASSSWNAGGDWIEREDASMQLLHSTQMVSGPAKKNITIGYPDSLVYEDNAYWLITTLAIPFAEELNYDKKQVVVLDEFTSEDSYIEWKVPEGKWKLISFFMCNTGQPLMVPSPNSIGPMIDHLSRRATKNHFDTIISRLARVSTQENQIKFLEVDSYEVWSAVDWSPNLIGEFKARYAYDPLPYLPILRGFRSDNVALDERFRGDYRRLVSDMIIENHFAQGMEIANKHGMKLFAEAGHGGYPRVDPLKAFGNCDIPMGEFWNMQRFWVTKEAASGANIYGKQIVASETLTGWNHWQHGPTDYKQLIDIAFCQGLNQLFFHTFAHNPEIVGKPGNAYHAGEHLNVNTTWWEMTRPFMDYVSRCSYLLRQGNFVGDACLYYGDQAPNLVPPQRIDPNLAPIYNKDQCLHCGKPKPIIVGELPGRDFDYINADIITTSLRVENGELVLPHGQSYQVMQIPDRVDISLEVLKSLETLVYNGAVVIGTKPDRSTSLKNYPACDDEVKAIADKLWGKADGISILSNNYGKGKVYWGKSVREVLEEMNIPPDFQVEGIANEHFEIDYIHRQTDAEDIYFVSNSSRNEQKITCVFRVDKNRVPELWDAETGLIQRRLNYAKEEDGISIAFTMDPFASRFVIFRDHSSGKNDEGLNYDLQHGFSQQTSMDVIDLSSQWKVEFDADMGAPEVYQFDRLTSWTDVDEKGINYYSGPAKYSKEFTLSEETLSKGTQAYITFEDIQEMARLTVNGNDCGIVWTPPYEVNISQYLKEGSNHISVRVINNWNNRIVGDLKHPDEKEYTQTNAKQKFTADSPLLESGLIGKVEIIFTNR